MYDNSATNISENKDVDFCYVQIYGDTSTLWLLITLCDMPRDLVT